MRKPWIVAGLVAVLLLGACGDPASAPEEAPPAATAPDASGCAA